MRTGYFFLFFLFLSLSVFAQNADTGIITEMSGTIELKPAGASKYTPAKVGDTVAADTVVSSGFKSTAVIKVGSATIVVQPITMLTLAEISQSQGTETVNVNLRAGRVQVDVKPPAGTRASFTVVTPTATASVRGTGFDMDTRNIRVRDGIVRYSGVRGGPMNVHAGGESKIDERRGKAYHPTSVNGEALLPRNIQGMESNPPQGGGQTGGGSGPGPGLGNGLGVGLGVGSGFEAGPGGSGSGSGSGLGEGLPPGPWGTGSQPSSPGTDFGFEFQ